MDANGGCADICNNTMGSFVCEDCPAGWIVNPEATECIGKYNQNVHILETVVYHVLLNKFTDNTPVIIGVRVVLG